MVSVVGTDTIDQFVGTLGWLNDSLCQFLPLELTYPESVLGRNLSTKN
jgi:hypothetical protein